MNIDGQCHCGLVAYQADIDPDQVSICHCTDCQTLTGSPYRVTVICSGEQIRMTGKSPKVYAKTGDNGRRRFQHFCAECGSPLFTSGEGGPDDWGIRGAAFVSATGSSQGGKSGAVRPHPGSTRSGDCRVGRPTSASDLALLNSPRGRLAQLVRAPALHAGCRRFESVTAYHPSHGDFRPRRVAGR